MTIKPKFLPLFALMLACTVPAQTAAQDNSEAVRATIAQLRQMATQMEGSLSTEEIAEMRKSADELEKSLADGSFAVPIAAAPAQPAIVTHMETEHGARYDWLIREEACAGYQWETWRTVSISGDRAAERNRLCKAAYALFEEYFYLARDLAPGRYEKLAAFDRAAHEAVDFYNRRN